MTEPEKFPNVGPALVEVKRRILGLSQVGEVMTFSIRTLEGGAVEIWQHDEARPSAANPQEATA